MLAEFFVSLLLLGLVIGVYIYDKTSSGLFMHVLSLLNPSSLALCYYFNACFVQNLYLTLYSYGTNYEKRYKMYKCTGILVAVFVLFLSIFFDDKELKSKKFTHCYYNNWYVSSIYLIGLGVFGYISIRLYYIIYKDSHSFGWVRAVTEVRMCKIITY